VDFAHILLIIKILEKQKSNLKGPNSI